MLQNSTTLKFMQERESGCERCEILPQRYSGELDLYLSAPVEGTRNTLWKILERIGVAIEDVDDMVLARPRPEQMQPMATWLIDGMGESERADTRALVLLRDGVPKLKDFAHMQSLESLLTRISGDNVIDLLRNGRLITYVHPIVHCSEPERVFAYECLTRGLEADGSLISPDYLFDVARRADLLFYLDRESRVNAIRSSKSLAQPAKLFINFNPATIYQPEYCLLTTMNALNEYGLSKDDVVFEVVESDKVENSEHLISILDYYRDQGFEVALDDLGAGYNSLTTLHRIRPNYVKLDMELIRDVDRDGFKQAITRSIFALAKELGIRTIAEGVERPEEHRWITEAGADYVQGFLFAKPLPVDEVALPA